MSALKYTSLFMLCQGSPLPCRHHVGCYKRIFTILMYYICEARLGTFVLHYSKQDAINSSIRNKTGLQQLRNTKAVT